MASTINASNSGFGGIVSTGDSSGQLDLQAAGTTVATIASTGMTITGTLSSSGVSNFAAGTAALPSITTTGDTNTGMWFPAADTIAFAEGGAESMRIDSSGNVLVGTTSTTGSTSNNAMAVSGIFKTISGSISAATATAVTLFTAPTLANGNYIVSVGINNTGEPAVYSAVSLISVDSTVIVATALKTATNMTITVSGQNVRATQASGITTNIVFTAIRIH